MTEHVVTPAQVDGSDEQQFVLLNLERWALLLGQALVHEGVPSEGEVGLRFVDAPDMAELNALHMGKTGPTDVLAFPLDFAELIRRDAINPEPLDAHGPPMIGDVVICPSVAADAVRDGHDLDDELALLVVHGALHLIGHDHYDEAERAVMQARERALLATFHTAATAERSGT